MEQEDHRLNQIEEKPATAKVEQPVCMAKCKSSSDLSGISEQNQASVSSDDDEIVFNVKAPKKHIDFKSMSLEEKKKFLEDKHSEYKKLVSVIEINTLWDQFERECTLKQLQAELTEQNVHLNRVLTKTERKIEKQATNKRIAKIMQKAQSIEANLKLEQEAANKPKISKNPIRFPINFQTEARAMAKMEKKKGEDGMDNKGKSSFQAPVIFSMKPLTEFKEFNLSKPRESRKQQA